MSAKTTAAATIAIVVCLVTPDVWRALPPRTNPVPESMAPRVVVLTSADLQDALAAKKQARRRHHQPVPLFWSRAQLGQSESHLAIAQDYAVAPASHGWTQYSLRTDRPRLPDFSQATVSLRPLPTGPPQPCPPQGAGFQCGSSPWMRLAPKTDMRINDATRTCIWAHPMTDHAVEIRYPEVHLPPGTSLFLHTALDDRAVDGQGAQVHLSVTFSKETKEITHPDQKGWRTTQVGLGQAKGPLTLTISTPHDGRRHFCYRFDTTASITPQKKP